MAVVPQIFRSKCLPTPCARTNCDPLELVILIRCAKTGVTRIGLIQGGKMGDGDARRLASFTVQASNCRIRAICLSPASISCLSPGQTVNDLKVYDLTRLGQSRWAAQFSFCNFSGHQVVGGLEESMLR